MSKVFNRLQTFAAKVLKVASYGTAAAVSAVCILSCAYTGARTTPLELRNKHIQQKQQQQPQQQQLPRTIRNEEPPRTIRNDDN